MTLPIYVITLERTPERQLYMQRQLDALNLDCEFVHGIDKFKLRSKAYRQEIAQQIGLSESQIEHKYWYKNEQGGLAVLLSHIKVYNLMMQRKIPKACILEDDIVISPVFNKILANIQKFSWDIVLFSHQSDFNRGMAKIVDFQMQERSNFIEGYEALKEHRKHYPQIKRLTTRQIMIIARLYLYLLKKYLGHLDYKIINLNKRSKNEIYRQSLCWEYSACRLGALAVPDRSSWHNVMQHYYLAKPYEPTSSAMAYGLTLGTATQYKEEAIFGQSVHIDDCQWHLFIKNKVKFFILTPPCIEAAYHYLYYSPRRYIREKYLKKY